MSAVVDDTAIVLQAASLLLDYPGLGSAEDLTLVDAALAELPEYPGRGLLLRFLGRWNNLSPSERERLYVDTFDIDGSVTLFLTERRDGSRDRGRALAGLRAACEECGAHLTRDELPDYLPLLLEAAGQVPEARRVLGGERPALEYLADALECRDSPFADVVAAVLAVTPPPAGPVAGG